MNDHRILNALSYFSILFAPIIVPVLIWIFAKSEEVSHHAKVALLTHIIPTIIGILCFSSVFVTAMTNSGILSSFTFFITASLFIFTLIAVVGLFIFNIVRGIQMLCVTKEKDDVWI
ncbi:DUF4870 domain-containing protein [Listeria monocytogenes]|uniref:DUF4870 domain-containing protein n=1 Tax=Listeria monocytogenes serotype 4a (strain M7) TaxID=1030009 RepID=A0A0E0UYW8_LISMM|nr:DUF4870 domain-containing protein [Listeria monocytogenes]ACK38727.1 conserved hypothetical protein [Listeria monocytogenes HCC23]AEH93283.1 hypothetical protein LMM7_2278 [Listeria monocytogenes M7]AKS54789.1 membrane protein [Listeria monocytogenes]EAC3109633.1 DUF4870 domain-containing protein [Listeria monocytogenes]EAC4664744.1 DUF4870 domain-containing protein [Listeria monocytogenes]